MIIVLLGGGTSLLAQGVLWLENGSRLQGNLIGVEYKHIAQSLVVVQWPNGQEFLVQGQKIVQVYLPGQGLLYPHRGKPQPLQGDDAVLQLRDGNLLVGELLDFPALSQVDSNLQVSLAGIKSKQHWRLRFDAGVPVEIEVPSFNVRSLFLGQYIAGINADGLSFAVMDLPSPEKKLWFAELGVQVLPPLPIALVAGLHYGPWLSRVAGFKRASAGRKRYGGARLDLAYEIISRRRYALEGGIYGAWWNRENMNPGEGVPVYERYGRAGLAVATNIWGMQVGAALPFWQWGELQRSVEWHAGYVWRFWP